MALTNILPSEQVDLIFGLGFTYEKNPTCRRHFAPSRIKILYNLYQYSKRHPSIYPGAKKQAAAKSIEMCTKTIYRFVNSSQFHLFGQKFNRDFSSNVYKLHSWVIECFENLERLGFMKFFATDFKRWRKLWTLQIPRFLMNKLMNISTWAELSMKNRKLSTNQRDKCPTKGETDVPLQGASLSSRGSLEDEVRQSTNPFSAKHEEIVETLEKEFGLKTGDIYYVTNYLGLRDMEGGISILRDRIQKGWNPKSPIKCFMHSVKAFKILRKAA